MTRKTNQAGIDLIKASEGCELLSYPDPATKGPPITVGYGHTGPEVTLGLKITQEQAEEYLKQDLEKFEKGVEGLVKVSISDNEFAALVCFSYNVGLGNLGSSTLLKLLNAGNPKSEVAEQFLRWDKAAGKVLPGLTTRRAAEKALFLTA